MLRARRRLDLTLLLLVSGCSGSPALAPDAAASADAGSADVSLPAPDAGPEDGGAPADAGPATTGALAAGLAEAECAFVARCRALELSAHGGQSACEVAREAAWSAALEAREDLERRESDARGCVDALAGAACWRTPRAYGRECWPVTSGGRRVGEGCARGEDCADGFCDSPTPGLACGTCAAWRGYDAPCALDPAHTCGPDAECEDDRCLPLPTIVQGCEDVCQGYLDCVYDNEATICLPPFELGDRCDPTPGLLRRCAEERKLACIDRVCVEAALVGLGEVCDAGHWCDGEALVCGPEGRCISRPRLGPGASCAVDLDCEPNAFCSAGVCAPRGDEGAACSSNSACTAPLECLGAPRACAMRPALTCP